MVPRAWSRNSKLPTEVLVELHAFKMRTTAHPSRAGTNRAKNYFDFHIYIHDSLKFSEKTIILLYAPPASDLNSNVFKNRCSARFDTDSKGETNQVLSASKAWSKVPITVCCIWQDFGRERFFHRAVDRQGNMHNHLANFLKATKISGIVHIDALYRFIWKQWLNFLKSD